MAARVRSGSRGGRRQTCGLRGQEGQRPPVSSTNFFSNILWALSESKVSTMLHKWGQHEPASRESRDSH